MGTLISDKIFADSKGELTQSDLGINYNKLFFDKDKRTIWRKGYPYGTSYYPLANEQGGSGDVFGTIRGHVIPERVENAVVMGSHNQASVNNSLALGEYNLSDSSNSYIFSIGNGKDSTQRSNLLQVNTGGELKTGYIAYTRLDTSYVTSLGEDATMNKVLNALLTPAEYYAPRPEDFDLSFGVSSIQNIAKGTPIQGFTLTCTWKSRKPKWYQPYIDKYLNENKSLPSDVSLDDLIYTTYLGKSLKSETTYTSTTYVRGKNPDNERIIIKIPAQTIEENEENITKTIYGGSTSYNLIVVNGNTTEFTPNEIGKYIICNGGEVKDINYGPSQVTFFKQLADNNVYVRSISKCFGAGTVTLNIPSLTYYVGVNIYTGIYVSDTNENVKDNNALIDIINKSQYKGTSLFTGNLNYFNFNTNSIDTIGTTRNDFKDKNNNTPGDNLNNKKFKYIWIGIPTNYINLKPNVQYNQFWIITQEKQNNPAVFGGDNTDDFNYIIENGEYTYVIAKTFGQIKQLTDKAKDTTTGDSLTVRNIGIKNYTDFTNPK